MSEDHGDQALALARIEVKIDTLIAANSDHEGRLRSLEQKGFVTTKQLWACVVGFSSVVYSIVAAVMLLAR